MSADSQTERSRTEQSHGDLSWLAPSWRAPPNVRAAFTLRSDGVVEEPGRVRAALSLPEEPAWLDQVHGAEVANLDGSLPGEPFDCKPRADASFTRTPRRICVVRVADCMPVLFADRDGQAVGAAHAGWRGMAGGVLEATVAALKTDPSRLCAWMGPTIGAAHFEVGDEVREAFLAWGAAAEAAFSRNARGRWQCDLYLLARLRLEALGVREIAGGGWSTYGDPRRFHSYRRDGSSGRMAALVWMSEPGVRPTP